MMDIVIKVEQLSKVYRLYDTPLDRLKESLHPFRKKYHKDFYALKDVSFNIQKGETIGIIGKNGSGKSTLLKILTGVLTPSGGNVITTGKITALLELGTGFNPEFTGVENIYFSGTIMGYSREEIHAKLDDIVSFADIGEFVYQPVKLYSSGMYVRLAFSCAVNVDPDILIVDEALAVGDVRFQKKCFDRMNSFKDRGKTIIIVSHDINTIKTFSSKCMLIDKGQIINIGDPAETVLKYMQMMFPEIETSQGVRHVSISAGDSPGKKPLDEFAPDVREGYCLEIVQEVATEKSFGAGGAWINWVRIYGLDKPNIFHGGETIKIDISYAWDKERIQFLSESEYLEPNLIAGIAFENKQGIVLTGVVTTLMESKEVNIDPLSNSTCILHYEITLPLLAAGDYFLSPGISLGKQENHIVIRKYDSIIHLNCIPKKKWIFGLMNWPINIYKESG